MQSGMVNASQLLASYLGSEHEKIGQGIVNSDFAGELKKLFPQQDNPAKPLSANPAAKSSDVAQASEPANTANPGTASAQEISQTKTSGKQDDSDPNTKIKNIKSKAKNADNLFVVNPAMVQTILAQFQYPAETIKESQTIQNKDGMISLGDLKALMDKNGPVESATPGQISPEQAQALIGAIIAKSSGTGQGKATYGSPNLPHSLQIKTDAPLSLDDFKALLDRVLQATNTNNSQLGGKGSDPLPTNIAAQTTVAPKAGQTQSLAASVLPSFISNGSDTSNSSVDNLFNRSTAANNNGPAALSGTKLEDATGNPGKTADALAAKVATASSTSPASFQEKATEFTATGHDRDGSQSVVETAPQLDTGNKAASPLAALAASASSGQKTSDEPIQSLSSLLDTFGAKIVSSGPAQEDPKPYNPTLPTGAQQDSVISQTQNLAVLAKGAEKQADKSSSPDSSPAQKLPDQMPDNLIKTASIQNPSGELSGDSNPGQTATLLQKDSAQAPAGQIDPGQTQTKFTEAVAIEATKIASELPNAKPTADVNGTTLATQTGQTADATKTAADAIRSLSSDPTATLLQKDSAQAPAGQTDAGLTRTKLTEDLALKIASELPNAKPAADVNEKAVPIQTGQTAETIKTAADALRSLSSDQTATIPQKDSAQTPAGQIDAGLTRTKLTEDLALKIASEPPDAKPATDVNVKAVPTQADEAVQANKTTLATQTGQPADANKTAASTQTDQTAETIKTAADALRSLSSDQTATIPQKDSTQAPAVQTDPAQTRTKLTVDVATKIATELSSAKPAADVNVKAVPTQTDQAVQANKTTLTTQTGQPTEANKTAASTQTDQAAETTKTAADAIRSLSSPQSDTASDADKTAASTQSLIRKFGLSTDDFPGLADQSAQAEVANTASTTQAGAAQKTDGLKTTLDHATLQAHDVATAGMGIEKQLKNPDPVQEAAMFQNSAARADGNQIVTSGMDNSAQNGFTYYDPYRAVELAQNYREQYSSMAAGQLVLEMEPDSLGKISIKVGARKDEISASIMTENEPARQALLKNSPELRQNLESQGLSLDKFMVDVNQNQTGRGNSEKWQEAQTQTAAAPTPIKAASTQTQSRPAYIRATGGQSQISLFA